MARRLAAAAAAIGLLAACGTPGPVPASGTSSGGSGSVTADQVALAAERTLIDVRTADEVAAGSLAGALHLDIQDPGFETALAELPREDGYLVYCRTGNRSAQAIERMRELGFTDLVNGGAFEDLAAAGVPTADGT